MPFVHIENMTKVAFGYIRVSTDDQEGGLDTQKDIVRFVSKIKGFDTVP